MLLVLTSAVEQTAHVGIAADVLAVSGAAAIDLAFRITDAAAATAFRTIDSA
jgi:hypothetical protein